MMDTQMQSGASLQICSYIHLTKIQGTRKVKEQEQEPAGRPELLHKEPHVYTLEGLAVVRTTFYKQCMFISVKSIFFKNFNNIRLFLGYIFFLLRYRSFFV